MSVSTNDFKNGMTIDMDGTLFQIIEFQHVKPGKGGAFVRTKLRNVRTGAVIERTFNAGVKVDQAIVERRGFQYLYPDGDEFVFMDLQTYDQVHVQRALMGEEASKVLVRRRPRHRSRATTASRSRSTFPPSLVLTITQTDPGVKGDTRTGALKPATLETGVVVNVPLFVEEGERIKVDTRSGEYIERVKA